ncbi:possible glycosyltransferase [Asticcacaulis excentricus]|uniref:Possible glycosyltransferase n=2 Tax=Asticcacaulis excentricus TaxID=78587 RepID=A0A3G9G3P5_9CAUL|nr:possible glycosyltransferase [Asticcacaulis excentricus]
MKKNLSRKGRGQLVPNLSVGNAQSVTDKEPRIGPASDEAKPQTAAPLANAPSVNGPQGAPKALKVEASAKVPAIAKPPLSAKGHIERSQVRGKTEGVPITSKTTTVPGREKRDGRVENIEKGVVNLTESTLVKTSGLAVNSVATTNAKRSAIVKSKAVADAPAVEVKAEASPKPDVAKREQRLPIERPGKPATNGPIAGVPETADVTLPPVGHDASVSIRTICYVSNTGQVEPWNDGSTRYRCFYPVEYLRRNGFYSGLIALRDVIGKEDIPEADAYVFHRPHYSEGFVKLIRGLKAKGVKLIADYDDLIFGVDNIFYSSQYEQRWDSVSLTGLFNENTRALRLFDAFTVSTPFLAEMVKKYHPSAKVVVIRNGFPKKVIDFTWQLFKAKNPTGHSMGYFPGTPTHDADFLTWHSNFAAALEQTDVPLKIIGPLSHDVGADLPNVIRRPGGSFMTMFEKMTDVTIATAPLKINPFNASKSNIKSIEAFLLGCYSLSTSANDAQILVDQGFDIKLTHPNDDNFVTKLREISEKPYLSIHNATLVRDLYSLEKVCAPLLEVFKS